MVTRRSTTSFLSPRIIFMLSISAFLLLVSLFLSAAPAHAQDTLFPPSPVKCFDDFGFLWQQNVDWENQDANGNVIADTYFSTDGTTTLTVPGPYPAAFSGPVFIKAHEVGVYDAGSSRPTEGEEADERVKVVLLKNGNVVWESDWSGDSATDDGLETGAISAEFDKGELGSTSLIDGFDEIRLVHPADSEFGYGVTAPNDYIPVGVCLQFEALGHIDGLVWCESDIAPNQSYDALAGDTLTAGVSVSVYPDANCDGTADGSAIATVETDSNGQYNFDSLPIGAAGSPICYVTQVDTADSDLNSCDSPITNPSIPVALDLLNPSEIFKNFGFDATSASLGSTVWTDSNNNGLLDGESGVQGVRVNLWADFDGNGSTDSFLGSTTTDANGDYSFIGLTPGTSYIVQFVAPASTNFTTQNTGDGTNDSDAFSTGGGAGYTSPVLLSAGENNLDVDAGLVTGIIGGGSATFGDTLYFDANNNGVQDANEPGIAGVTLNVFDTSGALVSTATTGSDGSYLVTLPAGTYTVAVDPNTLPAGAINTDDPDGTLDGTFTVVLNPADNLTDVDFGYVGPISIGNTVWEDSNANGTFDEPTSAGLAGVAVTLVLDTDGDGTISAGDSVVATTTTGADGTYTFDNLLPGEYIVQIDESNFTLGSGVLAGNTDPSANGGDPDNNIDGDNNGVAVPGQGVVSGAITLTTGGEQGADGNTNGTVDFGFLEGNGTTAVSMNNMLAGNNSNASVIIAMLVLILTLSTWSTVASNRNNH